MNRADALRVLRKLSAYQPSMPVDEYTGEVWAEGLADLDGPDILADALEEAGLNNTLWLTLLRQYPHLCRPGTYLMRRLRQNTQNA
jgi:hypothetical protein